MSQQMARILIVPLSLALIKHSQATYLQYSSEMTHILNSVRNYITEGTNSHRPNKEPPRGFQYAYSR